jgi:hypothetical protein
MQGALAPGDIDAFRLGNGGAVHLQVTFIGGGLVRLVAPAAGYEQTWEVAAGVPLNLQDMPRQESLRIELSGQGEWTLHVDASEAVEPVRCGEALETGINGGPAARLVALPARINGCIEHASDSDTFEIDPRTWADYTLFGVQASSTAAVALGVVIRDATGQSLAELMGEQGQPVRLPNLGPPLNEGPLTVEVFARQGAEVNTPYTVELRRPPGLVGPIEVEPNNTPDQATLVSELAVINGYIHRPGDTDYFRVTPPETWVVRLRATSPDGVDLQLLLDEHTTYGTTTINDTADGGEESLCSMRIGPEAPLSFGVQSRGVATTAERPYLVHFDVYSGSDFEVEPNDRPELAPASEPMNSAQFVRPLWLQLAPGIQSSTAAGHIFPSTERDVFALDVQGDPSATVTYHSVVVRLESGPLADYVLELLDDGGAIVARSERGRLGEPEVVSADISSGRYYARVSLATGEGCDVPYRLSVEQRGFPEQPVNPPEGSGESPAADDGSGATPSELTGETDEAGSPDQEQPGEGVPPDDNSLPDDGTLPDDQPAGNEQMPPSRPAPRPGYAPDTQTGNPARQGEVDRRLTPRSPDDEGLQPRP